jgi:hypothetical protein
MRYSDKTFASFGMMVVTAWLVITALKWPFRTAMFPVAIGIPVFFLAVVEFCFSLLGKKEDEAQKKGMDSELPQEIDRATARKRTLSITLWMVGFFFLILLIGFPLAVPLFLFLYVKFKGSEGWGISLGLAAVGTGAFYGLFVWLLEVPFTEGWLQRGLRFFGIG